MVTREEKGGKLRDWDLKQEGKRQGTTFKRHRHSTWQKLVRTNWVQDDGRFDFQGTLSSNAHCNTLATPPSAMTVLRPTIKGQKVGSGPVPGNLGPFPKIVGIIFPLISLWNYTAHKNWPRHISGPLAFLDGPHSVCGVCISLDKSDSYHFISEFFCDKERTLNSPGTDWYIHTII